MIRAIVTALVMAGICIDSRADAAFHLWEINEIYSNADGSVQFIELKTPDSAGANFEHFVAGHKITSSLFQGESAFEFSSNLPNPPGTRNRTILIATPGFAQLPGAVTPDYTLPSVNYFSTVADTVIFDGNSTPAGRIVFTAGQLPNDGVMSINRALAVSVNSPKNFAGQTGSLTPPLAPGDVNGDGAVDRMDAAQMTANFGRTAAATPAQGDLTGDGRVGLLDAINLQLNLDTPSPVAASGVPEPGTLGLALALAVAAGLFRLYRRSVVRRLQSRA